MRRTLLDQLGGLIAIGTLAASACTYQGDAPVLDGQDVHLTLIHTADWHSRLLPYEQTVGQVDQGLGLLPQNEPFGGAARMAYLIRRERERSGRVLHLDSGDVFQGAPIFNFFSGEAEIRALSEVGVDAMVIGNHEFDAGGANLARQLERWATFPALAANYLFVPFDDAAPEVPHLGRIAKPYTILSAQGLRVGVIGVGNLSSLTSIFELPNRLGIVPLASASVAQFYIDFLRPQVDLIVMLTHSGVNSDNRLVRNTSGIDVVLGGHLHVVLAPPQLATDCAQVDEEGRHFILVGNGEDPSAPPITRFCRPRQVPIVHSGAFMKYLGRVDLILSNDPGRVQDTVPPDADRFPELVYSRDLDGFEVVSHRFDLFPVDRTVPEDPRVAEMLEPYERELIQLIDLDLLVGYAPNSVRRFGAQNGDSPLGNLIADSMLLRLGIETDFSLTNTTGIRTDVSPGPVSVEQLFNVFPFDNTVTTMILSGREVEELFDFVARRSASRGCQSQAQISGARAILDCTGATCGGEEACARVIAIGPSSIPCSSDTDCLNENGGLCELRAGRSEEGLCLQPIDPDGSYELATSNYLAGGGSGFRVLQRNTTSIDTGLSMRDVLSDFIRNGPPCGADVDGRARTCTTDMDCPGGFTCACPGRVSFDDAMLLCRDDAGMQMCPGASGACVLEQCRQDVAEFRRERSCDDAIDARQRARCECDALSDAGEECKFLACIDASLGAATDHRIQMEAF